MSRLALFSLKSMLSFFYPIRILKFFHVPLKLPSSQMVHTGIAVYVASYFYYAFFLILQVVEFSTFAEASIILNSFRSSTYPEIYLKR
jgi:hypothetical protein